MASSICLTRFRQKRITLRARGKQVGLFADLFCPSDQPVMKRYVLFEPPTLGYTVPHAATHGMPE
jgi:hypothetical protein